MFAARGASAIFPEDRNNFGPRVSLAYQAPAGFVVRAAYAVVYGRLPLATLRAPLTETAMPASVTRVRIRPTTQAVCAQAATPGQGFGYPCVFQAQPSRAVAATASATVFDRRFRLPMVQQGSVAVARDLGKRTSVSLAYAFNLDRQLPGSTDFNLQPSTSAATFQLVGAPATPGVETGQRFTLPVYTARVTPAFGPVTGIVSHANGTYHAATLRAVTRLRQLTLSAAATRSKALDDAPFLSATPRTNSQFDPFVGGYDKGRSTLDYPWSVTALATWAPVLKTGSRLLRRALNGWEAASIFSARAGRPYSLVISGGMSLAGGHQSVNGSGGALYLPTVGRNTERLPATILENLRLARNFSIGKHLHGLAQVDALNLFNRRNASSVNQRAYLVGATGNGVTQLLFQDAAAIAAEGLNSTPFGTIDAASTSTASARRVQFEVRLAF